MVHQDHRNLQPHRPKNVPELEAGMTLVSALSLRSSRLTEVVYVGQGSFANKLSWAGTCLARDRKTIGQRGLYGWRGRVCYGPAVGNRGRQISVFKASLGHTARSCHRSLSWNLCSPRGIGNTQEIETQARLVSLRSNNPDQLSWL